jgi:hypothetical protein
MKRTLSRKKNKIIQKENTQKVSVRLSFKTKFKERLNSKKKKNKTKKKSVKGPNVKKNSCCSFL